jgi:dTDP-3-amino-3,4,6-trideoxy-alpha-D-glucose transaminase
LTDLRPGHRQCVEVWQRKLGELVERSRWILGPELEAFESEFASFCGAPWAVGTASGTDALTIALWLYGIRTPEQEVITSPLTAPFTALAVLRAGASVRFADVDENTLLLDPDQAAAASTPNTAAFLPVHLYGQAGPLGRWQTLARQRGAALVQDACQAHGARYSGRALTDYSPSAAYSFYPTKNLGALGDGGALCLAGESDREQARLLRDGGRRSGHVAETVGLNSRLDELQAAYLRIALTHLAAWNSRRQRLAALYEEELAPIPRELLRPVGRHPRSDHVFHLYVVRASRRQALQDFLADRGVLTGIHYPVPLHLQPAYASCGLRPGDLPVAERAAREVLSLPMGVHLGEEEIRYVGALIREFYLG